jgi:hypothetical protein
MQYGVDGERGSNEFFLREFCESEEVKRTIANNNRSALRKRGDNTERLGEQGSH